MKISVKELRSVIRSVIKENMFDEAPYGEFTKLLRAKESVDIGYDHFSKSLDNFKSYIRSALTHLLGPNWEDELKAEFGSVEERLDQAWDSNWSDYETICELGFAYDVTQTGCIDEYRHVMDFTYVRRNVRPLRVSDFSHDYDSDD